MRRTRRDLMIERRTLPSGSRVAKVTKLCDLAPHDTVCSVEWSKRGTYLSVGTNSGKVQIWDVAKLKLLRTLEGHRARVGTQVSSLLPGSRSQAPGWRFMTDSVRLPFTGMGVTCAV